MDPEIYWKLVNPTVRSAQSPGVLMTLAGLIRGSKPETLQPQLMSVCQALVDPEVCRNEQVSNEPLKTLDTIGNCQRPVFSLSVSQHMHKITNLGKFGLEVARE